MEAAFYCRRSSRGAQWLATAYNNAGIAYSDLGEAQKAAMLYYMAIDAVRKSQGSKLRLETIYCNLAGVLEDHHRCLFYLHAAETLARNNNNPGLMGLILLNQARSYEYLKNWAGGEQALKKAFALGQVQKDTLLQYRSLIKLGSLYLVRDSLEQAKTYLIKAHHVLPRGDNDVFQLNANQFLTGELYYKLGDYSNASYYYDHAYQTAASLRLREQEAEALRNLSDIYAATGRFEKAYTNLATYLVIKDSLLNEKIAADIHQLEVKYRTAEKDKQIASKQRQVEQKNNLIYAFAAAALGLLLLLSAFYANMRQSKRIMKQKEEIEQLKAVMKGEERERSRMARELHDGIGSMLAAIRMEAEHIAGQQQNASFEELRQMIDQTSGEVRRTAHNLIPAVLERSTLPEALTHFCANITSNDQLQVSLHFNGPVAMLDAPVSLMVYRMVQELVQNIIKHAKATQADVQISCYDQKLSIVVEDNGIGFDTGKKQTGIGLQNLEYRVRALQGHLSIDSMAGKSTTVFIEFDLMTLKTKI